MSTPPVSLSKITQIAVVAHDTDRATAFYRDTLGMKFLFAAPPQLSFFDAGGVRLMISPPEPEHDHPGSILYFDVPDIDAAHAALTAKGVSFGSGLTSPPLTRRTSPWVRRRTAPGAGARVTVVPAAAR